ncbi:MAG: extracellular solute-binding protein [Acetatifactor sp.]|nr:extracellular solute-binding protein [Acetatifactor sp.]
MKKKLVKLLALGLAMTMGLAACGNNDSGNSGTNGGGGSSDNSSLAGTYDITVWVSEAEGVADLTKEQIKRFCDANPGIVINATVEGISESNSASNMITDVESGADLFCFAQDQLTRLVEAGALNKLGTNTAETVRSLNTEVAVKAASVGNELYCYPLTADNGYFMFYDKSVVKEEHLGSLEDIIADCEAAGRMFSMECETSAWYVASFFFATGCVSDWTTDTSGSFTSINDTFNSPEGLIAMKGMEKLVKSSSFMSSSNTADFAAATPSAVVICGTWGVTAAKEALGDNYGVAEMPSFTVDGKTYHMGSYSGCKLMGVKPQADATKGAVLQQLALYLTNEECSLERFESQGWGPANKNAVESEAVKADEALQAFNAQGPYSISQGNIHGSWWDIAKLLGTNAREAKTDADLQAGLDAYTTSVQALFQMSEEEKNAFSLIGAFSGYNWDTDVPMTEDPAGTWTAEQEFKAGDEFKVRQGASWDVNFGVDGAPGGDNIVIEADGTYIVTLVYDSAAGTATLTVTAK